MSFEHFRTQVLLLHNEQSALDSLSAGFNDRYTVHRATSGTEALTTLGETPIDIIVSAQKLPGMSGAEALREAKKRSPETIGILLTGPDDTGSEALVGEKEVFQIIRGAISSGELGKLIDNATRQGRLLAIAESANDTNAAPERADEHIVMETAENGSSVITDATSSMPALNPQKLSAAASSGAQAVGVLILSKDDDFIATVRESSQDLHKVHAADTLAAAEKIINKETVGVLVVDTGMVGSNAEKVTVHLRRLSKRLVSIVAGRREHGEMLMGLINRGKVYRFLLKPVSAGRARLAVEASVKHHLEAPVTAFTLPDGTTEVPAGNNVPTARKPDAAPQSRKAPKLKPSAKSDTKARTVPGPAANTRTTPDKHRKSNIVPGVKRDAPARSAANDPVAKGQDFARNMIEIVSTVAEKIRGKDDRVDERAGRAATPGSNSTRNSGGPPLANPKVLGLAAAVVLVVVAGLFWIFSGGEDAPVTAPGESVAETPSNPATGPVSGDDGQSDSSNISVEALVSEARRLRNAGQIFAPAGDNAIEKFRSAALAAPGDRELADELADVVDETLSMGESAMLEGRVDDAALAVGQVQAADPTNPRLPFLTAQLEQMQLRDYLNTARAAILDSRYQDAADSITAARSLAPADGSSIDVVEAELEAARSAEQVDDVLASAAARLDSGQLLDPANDNARYYYELALASDPGNSTAEAGLKMIVSSLVLEARTAIDAGRFETATNLLNDARSIDAESAEVIAASQKMAISSLVLQAREAIDAGRLQAAANLLNDARGIDAGNTDVVAASRALEDARGRRAEAEREAQERQAAAEREAEARRQAANLEAQQEAEATAAAASQAPVESTDTDSGASLTGDAAPTKAAAGPETVAEAPQPRSNEPVPISSLTRTKYVAPKYPRSAERRSLSGWVDVVFTVRIDGSVGDVAIRASEPGDVFVSAAIKAVEKWEFDPVIENDRYVEKRAGVRMMFAIE